MQRPQLSAAFTSDGGDSFGLVGDGIHGVEQVGSNVAAGPVVVAQWPRPAINWDQTVPSRTLRAYSIMSIKHRWGAGVLGRR